jgi:uncharacterized protein YchJ
MDVPGVARVRDILQASVIAQKLDRPAPESPQPQPSVHDLESRIANLMGAEQELSQTNLKIQTHFEGESFLSKEAARAGENSGQQTRFVEAPDVPTPAPQLSIDDLESRIAALMAKEQALDLTNLKIQTHFAGDSFSSSKEAARAGENSGQQTRFHKDSLSSSKTPTNPPAIGRNTPCRCGSRLKYKRCCGQNATPIYAAPPPNHHVSG